MIIKNIDEVLEFMHGCEINLKFSEKTLRDIINYIQEYNQDGTNAEFIKSETQLKDLQNYTIDLSNRIDVFKDTLLKFMHISDEIEEDRFKNKESNE